MPNQADASEKGRQVSIMADINFKAHTTQSWLGGTLDPCDEAFANTESLEHLEAENWNQLNNHSDVGYIDDFMSLPYWTGIWIIQECLYSCLAILNAATMS